MLPDRIAAIIIREKKILLETGTGPDFFWTPGGKVESGESHNETLARELQEELRVTLKSMKNYLSYKTVNQIGRRDPRSKLRGMPHSANTSHVGSLQAAGYQTQHGNEVTGKEQLVHCYLSDFEGDLKPTEVIKEYGWFSKQDLVDGKPHVSKGMEKNLIPKLIEDGLI